MNNADRQRRYLERRLKGTSSDGQLPNLILSLTAVGQLQWLARHCAVMKRAMLERLLDEAESSIAAGSEPD
jgi:hypothetical protein